MPQILEICEYNMKLKKKNNGHTLLFKCFSNFKIC